MVLKPDKRLADVESCQHAYNKRMRRLDCGGQLVSSKELALCSDMTDKLSLSDCKDIVVVQDVEGVGASNSVLSFVDKDKKTGNGILVANEHYRDYISAAFSDHLATSSDDFVRPGHNNSPFFDDKLSQHACKFPGKGGHNCEQNSLPDVHNIESKFGESLTSGVICKDSEGHIFYDFFNDYSKSADHGISDLPSDECYLNGNAELDLSLSCNTLLFDDDDHGLEDFFPIDVPYTASIDYFYCKPVAIGQNHQEEIPSLGSSNCSKGSSEASGESSERWGYEYLIPMQDPILSSTEFCISDRDYCGCEDVDSIKCLRLRVEEAREWLLRELGLFDMGEVVSQKWSEAEKRLFHEEKMVLKHDKHLADDESCQHAYNKHLRRLDCDGQLVQSSELALCSDMTDKLSLSDCKDIVGVQGGVGVGASNSVLSFVDKNRKTGNGNFVAIEHYRDDVSAAFSDHLATGSDRIVRPGHNKSPFFVDKPSQRACKFP